MPDILPVVWDKLSDKNKLNKKGRIIIQNNLR